MPTQIHGNWSPTDEFNVRMGIQLQTRLLFEQKKFAELNALARRYSEGERTAAGTQKLQFFYDGLLEYAHLQQKSMNAPPDEREWEGMFRHVQEWIDEAPSPAAFVTLAKFHRDLGWQWRGLGVTNTVNDSALKPFRKQLQIAHEILAAHKSEAASDPEWYVTMEDLACEQEWTEKASEALYAEATAKNRYYDRVYYSIANRLEPKWGGSWDQVERFADFAARNTKDKLDDLLYVRIYMATEYCNCTDGRTRWDWNRIKSDFHNLQKRYPEPWNTNAFAYYACQKRDKAAAKSVIDKLPAIIEPAWDYDTDAYEQCKAWVST
jgi:hypothetical protein